MYSVTISGCQPITGLRLSGNNFVSEAEVSEADFAALPCGVEIASDGEDYEGIAGTHACMELVQVKKYADGWYFILRDIEATELSRLEAKVDYIAMMSGVEV